jgi:uncharacterized membrane protein YhaH (DUF805 family)
MAFLKREKKTGKRQLLWYSFLIVALATVVIISVLVLAGERYENEISKRYLELSLINAKEAYDEYEKPIVKLLYIGYKWGKNGLLDMENISRLNNQFIPVMEQFPILSGVTISNTSGEEYFLMRKGGTLLVRSWRGNMNPDLVAWYQVDSNYAVLREWKEQRKFIPRERPWFVNGLKRKSGEVGWYGPYRFFTLKKPGITGNIHWKNKNGVVTFLAFDLLLRNFIKDITLAGVTENSLNFVFSRDGVVLFYDDSSSSGEKSAVRISDYRDCYRKEIRTAVQKWLSDSLSTSDPVRIMVNGRAFLGAFSTVTGTGSGYTYLASIIPGEDIKSEINTRILLLAFFIFIVALFTLSATIFIYKKYVHSRNASNFWRIESKDSDGKIREIIATGEGEHVEFKSTMRKNLKTEKFGKEIEFAWLKTLAAFMNSSGGVLFIGVDDAGNVLGLEDDQFDNADHCRLHFKNVFNQYIGLEFSPYVKMEVYKIGEKEIAAIQCFASEKPVFLKISNNEEAFFIRSGPSSVKLAPSKILDYVRQRKGRGK